MTTKPENILYWATARKLGFYLENNSEELAKFAKTLNECGVDLTTETFRNFVAVTMSNGEKQLLCLKETDGKDMPENKIPSEHFLTVGQAATTLPLRGSIFQSVITQNFAKIPVTDGVKIPDQKPNQALVFLGGGKNGADVTATILAQVCTHENGKKPEASQLDYNGADATFSSIKRWLVEGLKKGVWQNPSKDKLTEHKELDVKFIELDKVVRIAKDGDNFKSVPPISMISEFEAERDYFSSLSRPGIAPTSKATETISR